MPFIALILFTEKGKYDERERKKETTSKAALNQKNASFDIWLHEPNDKHLLSILTAHFAKYIYNLCLCFFFGDECHAVKCVKLLIKIKVFAFPLYFTEIQFKHKMVKCFSAFLVRVQVHFNLYLLKFFKANMHIIIFSTNQNQWKQI